MAYAIATWLNTPDTWEVERDLSSFDGSFLIQDGALYKKATMSGLETVENAILNTELFELHGTKELGDILGHSQKTVDMIYREDLEDGSKLYGYELVGYTDLTIFSASDTLIKGEDGKYFTFTDGALREVPQPITEQSFTENPVDYEGLHAPMDKETLKTVAEKSTLDGKIFSLEIEPVQWSKKIKKMQIMSDVFSKALIKTSTGTYSILHGEWVDISSELVDSDNIIQSEFEEYGMDSLDDIPINLINSENLVEVIIWTYGHEVIEEVMQGVVQSIDTGKLFKLEIEDFDGTLDFPTLE